MSATKKGAARWSAVLEAVTVVLIAPLLLFPAFRSAWTAGALAVLASVWLVRWIATGRPGVPTPLDVPLLALSAMIPVAVWASAYPEVTLSKLTSLILGIAAFRATIDVADSPRRLGAATALFLLLGVGVATLGLLGTVWPNKLLGPGLRFLQVPQLLHGLPGAQAGIHPNELGGTLVLFLPVALSAGLLQGNGRGWVVRAARLSVLLVAAFLAAVLLLTQSRSAWLGVVVGLGVMAWLRWHWVGWLLLATVLLLLLGLWFMGPTQVTETFFQASTTDDAGTAVGAINLEGRVEIWNRAVSAIRDFSFTGCGLGTFRRVVPVFYPLFHVGPDKDVGHAHNLLLQVALDLGLPGLVAYVAMVGIAVWIGWRVAWAGVSHPARWLAPGIVGSLVAFHVYGLTDAIALGARPGVAFWTVLALAAGLWTSVEGRGRQPVGIVEAVEARDA